MYFFFLHLQTISKSLVCENALDFLYVPIPIISRISIIPVKHSIHEILNIFSICFFFYFFFHFCTLLDFDHPNVACETIECKKDGWKREEPSTIARKQSKTLKENIQI